MSERGPDFDELVGPEVESAERERLLRVHNALVDAGPPPELGSNLFWPPDPDSWRSRLRRRRVGVLALATVLAATSLALGFALGGSSGPRPERVITMTGTGIATGASASLEIFEEDQAGNWPMKLSFKWLPTLGSGQRYELWLTRDGRLEALCGSFVADLPSEFDGTIVVPMNAPYKLKEFDGWVVVEQGKTTPVLTT